jgi:hypothetical protein
MLGYKICQPIVVLAVRFVESDAALQPQPFESVDIDNSSVAFSASMKLSLFAIFLLSALVALVSGKDTDVLKAGTCTKRSSSKIKLSEENGNLEVEFEVDMNVANRLWTVVIKKNGNQVYKRNHRTNASSGSFSARTVLSGLTGAITASATSLSTAETCSASARYA